MRQNMGDSVGGWSMEDGMKDPGFPSMYYFSIDSPYLLKFLLFYVN